MKNIVILGSTGSIGVSALDVIKTLGPDYKVLAISAGRNGDLFLKQVLEFKPKYAVITSQEGYDTIKNLIPAGVKLLAPAQESLQEIASLKEADLIINGLVGAAGFKPLMSAIKAGKVIALANKEPIVMAGSVIMQECQKYGATIVPVDSEPSAVFQSLENCDIHTYRAAAKNIKKVLLTASGGPFLKYQGNLEEVSPKQALAHPRWKMGKKITIDSATLMNKGFETIEIMHLFNLPLEKVKIVVHPQSIVHSAVEYEDGAIVAELSNPDMRLPIQYAITYPKRYPCPVKSLSLLDMARLDFMEPDFSAFPCLSLAQHAAKKGGSFGAVLNGADEVCVEAFLKEKIKFTDIAKIIDRVFEAHAPSYKAQITLEEALSFDAWARQKAKEFIK
ncbi:MAG: 1-deoxy-D-xylulose-5-phosphate reductoisomerase [Elusimicrobiaceae bacterium]|nr:1-deoxy-D-xylulose-5-phosphate reductoisomerase [Elusimicrobiaceae bacterium]